jgi:hypothetical protein
MKALKERIEREVARLNAMTTPEIVRELYDAGIRGQRRRCTLCPLAVWFKRLIGNDMPEGYEIAVGENSIEIVQAGRLGAGLPLVQVLTHRPPYGAWGSLCYLVDQFDRGVWPNLIEGAAQ